VAPLGRLNYLFNTVMPGSVPPAEEDTEAPTEAPTEGYVTEGTAPEESTEGEDVTETPKKGCGSSLFASAAVTVAAAALAVGVSKKKENE